MQAAGCSRWPTAWGGHAAGEVASAAVIESLRSHDAEVTPGTMLQVLGRAVTEADREVARQASAAPARRMGTTLTAMLWSGDRAAFARIGDSWAFRLGAGELRQITGDRTIGKAGLGCQLPGPGARTVRGREAGSFGRSWLAGPAGRRSLPVVPGRAEPGRQYRGDPGRAGIRRHRCRNRPLGLSVTRLRLTRLPCSRRGRDMPCRSIVPRRGTAQTRPSASRWPLPGQGVPVDP